jgi:hypothetical protein
VQDLQLIYRELHFGHAVLLVRLDGTNGGIDGINLDCLLGTLLAPIGPIDSGRFHMPDRKKDNQPQERPTPRYNPQEDGSGGDTGAPPRGQGSNRARDNDEKRRQHDEDDERRFNK